MPDTAVTRDIAKSYIERMEARDWDGLGSLLAEKVVYEMPQTRERIPGRDRYVRFNADYPGDWHLEIHRLVADGGFAALWLDVNVGEEKMDAVVWLEIDDSGQISKVTDFWPENYDPPAGREHLVERY